VDAGSNLCGKRNGSGTRYRLDMARSAKAENGHAVSRLTDSGEETIRHLVALPLRMLAGTLGIFEAVLRAAADTLREMDPLDERVVELEKRVDSLEEQTTGRRESARSTGAAKKRTPTARAAAETERTGSPSPVPGSDTAAGRGPSPPGVSETSS
jgi:cell division protein FtsB